MKTFEEQNDKRFLIKGKSYKLFRITNIMIVVLNSVVMLIHVILFFKAGHLLSGHTYGSPDKYGDYARGLYRSEVVKIDQILFIMLLIPIFLCILNVLNNKIQIKIIKPYNHSREIVVENLKQNGKYIDETFVYFFYAIMFIGLIIRFISYIAYS